MITLIWPASRPVAEASRSGDSRPESAAPEARDASASRIDVRFGMLRLSASYFSPLVASDSSNKSVAPQITLLPQITLKPDAVLEPQITLLPQITFEPVRTADPQMTLLP